MAAGKQSGKAPAKGGSKPARGGKDTKAEVEDGPEEAGAPKQPARLKIKYREEIVPKMRDHFKYKNVMMVPRLEKVVLNMGVGEAIGNPKVLDAAVSDLVAITGQKPVVTKAKKSIAAFKLRAGVNIGAKVTLRGDRMFYFLDKLFNVVLPRIRDFRGLPNKSFDGRGNYSFGLKEQTIFPEIEYDKVDKVRGMDIIIVTTARTDEEALHFLRLLGAPLKEAGAATS
ncbi:MAG TPA: 50S ribosomal protein L5 [Candidatus Xenobia bacterium]|jgi:large subunit ribosomal protein L5